VKLFHALPKREATLRNLKHLVFCLCLFSAPPLCAADKSPAELDPTLARLSQLIGGTWANDDPKFRIEHRYEWAFDKTVIRGSALIGKGSPNEQQGEAFLGWDPVNKTAYYLDLHGGRTIYKGNVKLDGETIQFDFETLVGAPGKWRDLMKFSDPDTFQFTLYTAKDDTWAPLFTQTMKRKPEAIDENRLVSEGIVDAPREAVWAALTTKEGLESWNVAHAEVDFKVGGKMLTHYNADGKIGDPNTIENIILCFDPNRFYAIKVGTPPERFPFKEAIKCVWTVIYLDEVGPSRTHVRVVGLGYGGDEESKKLKAFFDQGNSYTVKKLQEKFAAAQERKPAD
jgi:uncharacterized protein YndB with AHSA1/START domain